MDDTGTIQFANLATARIFGYDPAELVGGPLTVLMPEFMRELHEKGFKRYLATGPRAPETMFDHLYAALPKSYVSQRDELRGAPHG